MYKDIMMKIWSFMANFAPLIWMHFWSSNLSLEDFSKSLLRRGHNYYLLNYPFSLLYLLEIFHLDPVKFAKMGGTFWLVFLLLLPFHAVSQKWYSESKYEIQKMNCFLFLTLILNIISIHTILNAKLSNFIIQHAL